MAKRRRSKQRYKESFAAWYDNNEYWRRPGRVNLWPKVSKSRKFKSVDRQLVLFPQRRKVVNNLVAHRVLVPGWAKQVKRSFECVRARKRIRRAYFSFLKSLPSGKGSKLDRPHKNKFTLSKRCQ